LLLSISFSNIEMQILQVGIKPEYQTRHCICINTSPILCWIIYCQHKYNF